MQQELEIEYKNLLNKNEYDKLATDLFGDAPSTDKISQTNHYFDTNKQALKASNAAVRIRISNKVNELTFKVPSQDFLMETSISLNDNQVTQILNKGRFSLKQITNQTIELGLPNITAQTDFIHFNQFNTIRREKRIGDNLLVLDQVTFQNGLVDYELEVECTNPQDGKSFFNNLLDQYSIPKRPTLPKIARAEKNK